MRIPIAIVLSVLLGADPAAASGRAIHDRHAPGSAGLAGSAGAADRAELVAAVSARLRPTARAATGSATVTPAAGSLRVAVDRDTKQWAFGTAVSPAAAAEGQYPEGWLYVAHRERGRWRVALQGEPDFARLSARAPILRADERRVLGAPPAPAPPAGRTAPNSPAAGNAAPGAGTAPNSPGGGNAAQGGETRTPVAGTGGQGGMAGASAAAATRAGTARSQPLADRRTGMRLPFGVGQTWRYTGGPHPMQGAVRSSIDLAGGDGRVLAARSGVAYTMCPNRKGWVRVVHDRGFATDYYHLAGNPAFAGQRVAEGQFLGNIGTDVSCGGAATGKHVHFSLLRDGAYVSINGYSFGKWVIQSAAGSYDGYAWHGSYGIRANGSTIYNYGALGFRQGVVDANGSRTLNRRAGPGTGYRLVGTVPDGATVTVSCSRRGTTHTGRYGYTSNLWNRLSDGSWVSDVFLSTGTAEPVSGYCP